MHYTPKGLVKLELGLPVIVSIAYINLETVDVRLSTHRTTHSINLIPTAYPKKNLIPTKKHGQSCCVLNF